MVTLTFQCGSLPQLKEELAAFLNGTLPPVMNSKPTLAPTNTVGEQIEKAEVAVVLVEQTEDPSEPSFLPIQEKKRRGRKPKAQTALACEPSEDESAEKPATAQEAEAQESVAASSAVSVPPPIINKEAVHQALQQVNIAVGLPKAREILKAFKVNRISEITKEQFKAFIEKCNEAVMLEG